LPNPTSLYNIKRASRDKWEIMKKLVLVDGNAIVHRAYHALPPLNKKDGKPTNAVYGFFSMILKIVTDLNPESLIVCFDRPKPTFRKQMFAGYQSTRPKMEDALSDQFVMIHKIFLPGLDVRQS